MSSIFGVSKKDVVFYISAEENTLRQMPKYNGYTNGCGAHGDKKYNRTKAKRQQRKEIGNVY